MLILSRKENEEILLGNDIRIVVTSINKGVVKLGIEAPKNMMILRSELASEIKDSNKEASKNDKSENLSQLLDKFQK